MINHRLKVARKAKKLTQEQLANKLQTTKGTISNYENGYSTPSNEMLVLLSEVLDVSTDYLLGRTDQKNTPNDYEIQTIAAHHDGDEWTEEELEEIERFKEFVRMKRGNKQE